MCNRDCNSDVFLVTIVCSHNCIHFFFPGQLKVCKKAEAAEQIKCLYKMFNEADCTMLEVDGMVVAASRCASRCSQSLRQPVHQSLQQSL